MSDIATLITQVQTEAKREEFPIDIPVYQSAKLDPTYPVLYAGNLQSPLCFFGRDLGKDEVHARQPLIGAAGTLVRQGFYQVIHQQKTTNPKELQTICDRALLANTVPYKPPGNKAYPVKVKKRFRPYIERLLAIHWQGTQIITLGTEAFKWYAPYGAKGELDSFYRRSDRFEAKLTVSLTATDTAGHTFSKSVILLPLPHPSPLNQKYYDAFPRMLQQRLTQVEF
ncbi:MAG TPA: uracil-DNA glycosylase family protein [Xenococcaceae cyanobacterium]